MGLAEDRRRARDAWNQRCQVNSRKVSAQASRAFVACVESIPGPACMRSRIDGLFHYPGGYFSGVVRLYPACPRPAPICSLQRDGTSYGAVDGTTDYRSVFRASLIILGEQKGRHNSSDQGEDHT